MISCVLATMYGKLWLGIHHDSLPDIRTLASETFSCPKTTIIISRKKNFPFLFVTYVK